MWDLGERFIIDDDGRIAQWLFARAGGALRPYDLAVGIAGADGALVGGFVFTDFDGKTLEAHFWGPGSLRAGVVRFLFRTALEKFNAAGVVVKASREHMARGCRKLGAQLVRANNEHGEFLFARPLIEKLSGMKET